MGARLSLLAVFLGVAVGFSPANAAQWSVAERNCQFTPSLRFINPGDSVTWTYEEDSTTTCGGQNHRVLSEQGDPQSFDSGPCPNAVSPRHTCMNDPPKRRTFTVTLTRPGTYLYYCPFHGSPPNADGTCNGGMCGEIVINPPPTRSPSVSPSATPTKARPTPTASSPRPAASSSASPSPSSSASVLASGPNGGGGAGRGIIAVAVIAVLAALGGVVWRVFIAQR